LASGSAFIPRQKEKAPMLLRAMFDENLADYVSSALLANLQIPAGKLNACRISQYAG